MTTAEKVWTRAEIEEKLRASQKWVERGLLAIFEKQTLHEKQSETTVEHNNVGFNSAHAGVGTYMAKWLKEGKHLDGNWIAKGRKIALFYSGQLMKIANGEI